MSSQPIAFHVMMRLVNGRVIAPSPCARRSVARTVLEMASGQRLLAFCAADTHLHLLVMLARAAVGALTRRIAVSIQRRLHRGQTRFAPPYPKPVWDQSHLYNAFEYILKQHQRHKLPWDPLSESSNLPDLLGMRTIGGWTAQHVREHLPRIDRRVLLDCLGLQALEPAREEKVPLEELESAAASAVGQLRSPLSLPARRAVVAVAGRDVTVRELATHFGVSQRTIIRHRQGPVDNQLTRAIRLQLAARRALAPAPSGSFVPGPRTRDATRDIELQTTRDLVAAREGRGRGFAASGGR